MKRFSWALNHLLGKPCRAEEKKKKKKNGNRKEHRKHLCVDAGGLFQAGGGGEGRQPSSTLAQFCAPSVTVKSVKEEMVCSSAFWVVGWGS